MSRNTSADRVNAKDLFSAVSEGDTITWGDREEPVTVYRHVTEDDLHGQVITMGEVSEDMAEQAVWEAEHADGKNDLIRAGDLLTSDLTGDEFLIARGPRGGCYLLTLWWSKNGGQWSASVALYRRTRSDSPREPWSWENTIHVQRVGREDVDRDAFDEGGPWVRHTDVDGRNVWADSLEGDAWEHSEDLTGVAREPEPPEGEEIVDTLETVSEGDTLTVNGREGEVTEVRDEYSGSLADGVTILMDVDGDTLYVRTFADKGYAAITNVQEDVTDVSVE